MIAETGLAIGGLVLGFLLGLRVAVGRQRRQEFNYYSDGLFDRLEKQRQMVLGGVFPHDARDMERAHFAEVKRRLGYFRRKRFNDAIEDYMAAREQCGYSVKGVYQFSKPELLLRAIDRLQEFMPHR